MALKGLVHPWRSSSQVHAICHHLRGVVLGRTYQFYLSLSVCPFIYVGCLANLHHWPLSKVNTQESNASSKLEFTESSKFFFHPSKRVLLSTVTAAR